MAAGPLSVPDGPTSQGPDVARQKFLEELKEKEKETGKYDLNSDAGAPKAVPKPAATFELKEVRFGASAQLSAAELQAVVAPYIGTQVGYPDLLKIRNEVNALYQKKQILSSRADIRPQKIVAGVVFVDIVEGRLSKVKVTGNTYTREQYVADVVPFATNDLINSGLLKDRANNFRISGVASVEANLVPGANVGETDIVLAVQESKRFQATVFVNNEASDSVGQNQGGVSLVYNAPLGINDKLSAYASGSQGSFYNSVGYAIPLGMRGTLLRTSFSSSSSSVVAGPYKYFDVKGNSSTNQLGLTQLLVTAEDWDLSGNADWSQIKSQNTVSGFGLSDTLTDLQAIGLNGTLRYSNRVLNASVTHNSGTVTGKPLPASSASSSQVSGGWLESFSPGHYVYFKAFMQQASQAVMPSAMGMSLGGAGTVRGYALGAVSGDEGHYANVEWHYPVMNGLNAFLLYDTGSTGTKGLAKTELSSVGVGVDWSWNNKAQVNLTYATPQKVVNTNQEPYRLTARLNWSF